MRVSSSTAILAAVRLAPALQCASSLLRLRWGCACAHAPPGAGVAAERTGTVLTFARCAEPRCARLAGVGGGSCADPRPRAVGVAYAVCLRAQVVASRSIDCGVCSRDDVPGRDCLHASRESAPHDDGPALGGCVAELAGAIGGRVDGQESAHGTPVVVIWDHDGQDGRN